MRCEPCALTFAPFNELSSKTERGEGVTGKASHHTALIHESLLGHSAMESAAAVTFSSIICSCSVS